MKKCIVYVTQKCVVYEFSCIVCFIFILIRYFMLLLLLLFVRSGKFFVDVLANPRFSRKRAGSVALSTIFCVESVEQDWPVWKYPFYE